MLSGARETQLVVHLPTGPPSTLGAPPLEALDCRKMSLDPCGRLLARHQHVQPVVTHEQRGTRRCALAPADAILLFFERLYFVDDSNEIDKEMSLHWCGVGGRLSQSVPPDFVGEAVACGCLCAAVKSGLERKNYERKKESAFSRICVNSSLFAAF